eukprot:c2726_g1_i1 orf=1-228(-)
MVWHGSLQINQLLTQSNYGEHHEECRKPEEAGHAPPNEMQARLTSPTSNAHNQYEFANPLLLGFQIPAAHSAYHSH